ncbi:SprT family zinc-dependent metalloprotease [Dechloromonas sp. ZY10]|uniref:M48 family metallopeptidase n=1 Tax=Dechloromonas aquae TaxID=2664436 RepID=UPI003528B255
MRYRLRRSRRRSTGLRIDGAGLLVAAPLRARIGDIESLLQQHQQWVLDKLAAWRERPPPAPLALHDGARIFVLDRELTVSIATAGRASWQVDGSTLQLRTTPTVNAEKCLKTALQALAREHFGARLQALAPLLGVTAPPLRLSSARTRWGSCSRRNGQATIMLNWKLLLLPAALGDYVVIHELAHLHEMNHSPRFWSHVAAACPDWQARRAELRRLGRQLPEFAG